jgi:hypothetical protein
MNRGKVTNSYFIRAGIFNDLCAQLLLLIVPGFAGYSTLAASLYNIYGYPFQFVNLK